MAGDDNVLYLHPHHIHHAHQPSYRHLQVLFLARRSSVSFHIVLYSKV